MATGPDPWAQLAVNVAITAFTHPLGYVKTLIQVGYEPLPPRPGMNMFFRETMQLPGFFKYVRLSRNVMADDLLEAILMLRGKGLLIGDEKAGHIRAVDGFFGMYRGVVPRMFAAVTGSLVARATSDRLDETFPTEGDNSEASKQKVGKVSTEVFLIQTAKMTVSHCCAAIASHPFQVVAVRQMVQFVGRESKYSGFFTPYAEVYRQNGILGFFAGLAPRLLMEVFTLWLARTLFHLVNNYLLDEQMSNVSEVRSYLQAITGFLAGIVTYPFGLVSTLTIVNESGLVVGSPPFMPLYGNWLDCWRDISKKGLLKRGSSLFFRQYNPAAVSVEAIPVTPLD